MLLHNCEDLFRFYKSACQSPSIKINKQTNKQNESHTFSYFLQKYFSWIEQTCQTHHHGLLRQEVVHPLLNEVAQHQENLLLQNNEINKLTVSVAKCGATSWQSSLGLKLGVSLALNTLSGLFFMTPEFCPKWRVRKVSFEFCFLTKIKPSQERYLR